MEQAQADTRTEAVLDAAGSLRIGYQGLTMEDMEALKALKNSPFWRVYRELLIKAMGEYMRASTMVTSVDGVVKMLHASGMAAGINFSINQLTVLCDSFDAKGKKELEKASRPNVPFTRG